MRCSPMDFKWWPYTNFLVLIFWFKLRPFTICRKDATTSANDSEARDACKCKCTAEKQCATCDDIQYMANVWACNMNKPSHVGYFGGLTTQSMLHAV